MRIVSRRSFTNEKIDNVFCVIHLLCLPALCAGKMLHPFGKEETASQEQLFGFFCECLRRGEWELAQACVPQLQEAHGDIPKKVEDILQALVVCPDELR